jgi:hypothetical protein
VSDPAVLPYLPTVPAEKAGAAPEVIASVRYGAGIAGALLVLAIGKLAARGKKAAVPALAPPPVLRPQDQDAAR